MADLIVFIALGAIVYYCFTISLLLGCAVLALILVFGNA